MSIKSHADANYRFIVAYQESMYALRSQVGWADSAHAVTIPTWATSCPPYIAK